MSDEKSDFARARQAVADELGVGSGAKGSVGGGLTYSPVPLETKPSPFSSSASDRALRIWAVEQAVKMGLHRDHVMIQAREFEDYVREAKGKPLWTF